MGSQRSKLRGVANKFRYKLVQTEIEGVSRSLRNSTKSLCQNLKDNPDISGNLFKIQRERQDLIEIIEQTINELRENGSFTTLIAKVTKDIDDQNRLRGSLRREREISDTARQLDKEIAQEKLRHLRQVAEQQALITQLKQQLKSIKSKTAIDVNSLQTVAEARTCSTARVHRQTERSQEIKASSLERHRETEKMVHASTLEFLEMKQQELANKLTWRANIESRDELERRCLVKSHKERGAAAAIQSAVRAFLDRKAEEDARRAADKKKKKGGKK